MKKTVNLIKLLSLMGVFLVLACSCQKDDDNDNGVNNNSGEPVLTTIDVTSLTQTTTISGGSITSDGGSTITARGVCWSTGANPTITDNKTTDGAGSGDFTSNVSGLTENTTYYLRAYATNSNGTGYGNEISFTTLQSASYGSFTDSRDGTVYQTVTIGNQEWMAENLKYLPSVVRGVQHENPLDFAPISLTTPYYYVYGYDGEDVAAAKQTTNYNTYGVLYNWQAALTACPAGWHLPGDDEWTALTDYLGGFLVAGSKLKEVGTAHWESPNSDATNESGFTALPGGFVSSTSLDIGQQGFWWSATENITNYAWSRLLNTSGSSMGVNHHRMEHGFSVRCVKDN